MDEPHNHYSKSKKPPQKTTHCMIPFIKNVQKRQTYKDKKTDQWHGVGLGVDCKQRMENLWEG